MISDKSAIWLTNAEGRVRRLAIKGKWKLLDRRQAPASESIYITLEKQKRVFRIRISCHGGAPEHLESDNASIVYPPAAGMFDKSLDDLAFMLLPPRKVKRIGTQRPEA